MGSSHSLSFPCWKFSTLTFSLLGRVWARHSLFYGQILKLGFDREGLGSGVSCSHRQGDGRKISLTPFHKGEKEHFSMFPLCLQAAIRCHQSASLRCVQMKDYSDKMEKRDPQGMGPSGGGGCAGLRLLNRKCLAAEDQGEITHSVTFAY